MRSTDPPHDLRMTDPQRIAHGRARRGLARDLELADWLERRSYHGDDYELARVQELRAAAGAAGSVSVVLPTREVASTIGPILDALVPLREAGVIDELLVIDAASADGTAAIAAAHGATVVQESAVLPEHGPARGKGDALWRSLAVTRGEIVAFLDADTEDFHPGFALGLLGPLLADPALQFLKGAFRRPFRLGDRTLPDGGGRVTELVARPLLNLHVPELAGFVQPLAGEFAARRSLLEQLPFPVGYGVEIATLIDALRHAGLDALAQVDLGTRQNRHQSLRALSAMAYAVMVAAERRIHGDGAVALAAPGPLALPHDGHLEVQQVAVEERPPLRALTRAA
jgi:glucosyl-3-phosphoglycerate synthase